MKRIIQLLICFTIILFLISCSGKNPEVSFYYWKTTFKLTKIETDCITRNNVKTLYVRFFDIDWNAENNQAFPESPVQFDQPVQNLNIVPVIYIKNKVMIRENPDLNSLSENILKLINQIAVKNNINISEIQFDCDWTPKSRENFMQFIRIFKKVSAKQVSVTIRLHQVKYYMETGIPDAAYGVLMYYNMGAIASDSLNSVYDRIISQGYLKGMEKYPLKLNIALPVFLRGVHISNKKVVGLISKIDANSFAGDTNFIVNSETEIMAKNANFKFGYYFKAGDRIKIESISYNQLTEMVKDLRKNLKKQPEQIIFFDLDSFNLNNYKNEKQNFQKIARYF